MNNSNWNKPLIITPKSSDPNLARTVLARRFSKKKIVFGLVILVGLIFLVIFGFNFFQTYKANKSVLTSSQVLEAVNKLMVLPTDEEPVVKTVKTLDGLNYQPFFMNAEVGDEFLLFEKAKRAVLYRPSVNKIIEASRID